MFCSLPDPKFRPTFPGALKYKGSVRNKTKKTLIHKYMRPAKKIFNHRWRTFYYLASLTFVLMFSVSLYGQVPAESDPPFVSCDSPDQRIAVKVIAKEIDNGGQKKRFWMIKELPKAGDILIDDAELRRLLLETISKMSPSEDNFKVTINNSPAVFHRGLMSLTNDIEDYDLEIEAPENIDERLPTDEEVAGSVTKIVVLCVDYTVPPLKTRLATLKVLLSTTKDPTNSSSITKDSKLLDFDPDLSGKPAGESSVNFVFYQRDLDDAKGDVTVTDARARVEEELTKVAQKAIQAAKPVIISNGEIVPCSDSKREDFVSAVRAGLIGYKLPDAIEWNNGLIVDARCKSLDSRDEWTIQVEGLRLVRSVVIEAIDEDRVNKQTGEVSEKPADNQPRLRLKLDKKASEALKVKAGRIPTSEQIENDASPVTSPFSKKVKKILKPTSKPFAGTGDPATDAVIFFPVHPKIREISLGVEANYSVESKLTGRLTARFENLFGLSESMSLSAEAGSEVQRYLFSFTKSFEDQEARTPRFELKDLSVQIQVFKDKDVRLSNLTTDEIALREAGSTARLSFGYDSLTAEESANRDNLSITDRKKNHYGVLMDLTAVYKDVNIKNNDGLLTITGIDPSLLPAARTQNTKFSFGVNGFYSRDFRRPSKAGLGLFSSSVKSVFDKGTRAFGADYSYSKISTLVQTELQFGWQTSTDVFISYKQGINAGSRGTPVFELPRLGGPDNLRGIEEGERIGRNLYFGQFDVGFNSLTLLNMLQGKNKVRGNEDFGLDETSESAPGLKDYLSKIYLKVFYDFGRIKDDTSYTTNPNFRRTAKGYGIAVELRRLVRDQKGNNINFSFGYARSPESILHRRGLFFAGVGYEF